ncbi:MULTISPECIES: glycosyltransferase family 2 protein [Cyanophyceae]|uniref:glycosyltransferase family 2 protein n=1 Tax=Cyanophyceae TaxID=3028117 RepID=UPI001687306A|nr:glycosyltransferase family 2 protein [Trichocoleus sp. FACHB-69]MBD1935704.1 glycosyltransferase family 2 protein [Trichocoleus sp. FACHB-69]
MKKFSVIIPTYKVEKYIAAAIESVLNQTYQNFEIIVVNDDSPDRSIEICQQFTDSRIKIVSQKNRGLAGARNTGIRHAQGDYIALLDGDDLWLPEKLEKHFEHLESSPAVGISFSRSAFIDEAGNSLGTYLMPKLKEITPPDLLRDNPVGNGSAAVIRKEVLEAIKFQDNFYGTVEYFYFDDVFRQAEDIECWLRILLQTNWKIEGIPEALTLYRVNSGGLSASLLNQFEALQKVIEKTRSYAPELIAQWENPTKAYQLRYLARSAVRLKAGSMAVQLMHQALAAHWRLVFEQPRRTLMTLAAAYMLWLLPQPLYAQIEAVAAKMTAATQKRRILQEQSGQSI